MDISNFPINAGTCRCDEQAIGFNGMPARRRRYPHTNEPKEVLQDEIGGRPRAQMPSGGRDRAQAARPFSQGRDAYTVPARAAGAEADTCSQRYFDLSHGLAIIAEAAEPPTGRRYPGRNQALSRRHCPENPRAKSMPWRPLLSGLPCHTTHGQAVRRKAETAH